MSASICERCIKPNGWMLMDPMYTHVCGDCAHNDEFVHKFNGMYRKANLCRCCGEMKQYDGEIVEDYPFYCGGSPRCCP